MQTKVARAPFFVVCAQEVLQALAQCTGAAASSEQGGDPVLSSAVSAAGELLRRLESEVEGMRGRNTALAEDVFRLTGAGVCVWTRCRVSGL